MVDKSRAQLSDATGDGMIVDQQSAIADYTFTYTTDDPGITAGDSVTIADGDTPTVAELLEMGEDLAAKVNAILAALRAHGLIAS